MVEFIIEKVIREQRECYKGVKKILLGNKENVTGEQRVQES